MINQDDALKAGFGTIDSAQKLPKEKMEKIKQIKSILPALVNGDGLVDVSALKDLLGIENFASLNQGYALNFAGKGLAKIKADEPTKKGLKVEEAQSKNFDDTGNVIIRGDNLDVLKILHQNYTGKVKMIYIDPPYNTGNAGFVYADNFRVKEAELIERFGIEEDAVDFLASMFGSQTHSGWLFAMYPRLKLARELLTDDGVIFISIDDNELANLKLLCDEIFGESNFIANITWRKKAGGGQDSEYFAREHEYVLCYRKGDEFLMTFRMRQVEENEFRKIKNEQQCRFIKLEKWGAGSLREDAPSLYYSITDPDGNEFYPSAPDGRNGRWRKRPESLDSDHIHWEKKDGNWTPYEVVYFDESDKEKRIKDRTIFYNLATTTDAANEQKALFGKKPFDNSKPVGLIRRTLELATTGVDDCIVLDFFAGSGTTAEAVMQLNAEDGGNRKFILVQWDEVIDEQSSLQSHQFCTDNKLAPVISSITIERVNRAGEQLQSQNGKLGHALDIGYKVFSLTDRPTLEETEDGQLQLQINWATTSDLLYNMMSMSGEVLLTDNIEEVEANLLYKVGNSYYVLGECQTPLEQYASHRIYINGYADIRLEQWLNMLGLNKENVKVLY